VHCNINFYLMEGSIYQLALLVILKAGQLFLSAIWNSPVLLILDYLLWSEVFIYSLCVMHCLSFCYVYCFDNNFSQSWIQVKWITKHNFITVALQCFSLGREGCCHYSLSLMYRLNQTESAILM
jgi:hypothetical protein